MIVETQTFREVARGWFQRHRANHKTCNVEKLERGAPVLINEKCYIFNGIGTSEFGDKLVKVTYLSTRTRYNFTYDRFQETAKVL